MTGNNVVPYGTRLRIDNIPCTHISNNAPSQKQNNDPHGNKRNKRTQHGHDKETNQT